MGEYEASYEIAGMAKNENLIRIKRVITEYKNNELAKTKFSPAAMAAKIIIENDHTEAEIQTDGDWIKTIHHRQSTKIVSNGTKIGESNTTFKTERLPSGPTGVFPESVAALQEMMAACVKEKQTQNLYKTDPELNAMAEGRDLPGVIELFLKKRGKDGYLESKQAEMFLVNYLKLHPQETFKIIDFIDKRKTNNLDDKEELALWNVIAVAGHHEAQQAIMDAINSSTFNTQTRLTAAMHLFNLASPEPFLVDALWKRQQIGAVDEENPQELQIKHTALFALGAMAGNVNISEDLRASIITNLSKQLRNAEKPKETVDALIAIGNSGGRNSCSRQNHS